MKATKAMKTMKVVRSDEQHNDDFKCHVEKEKGVPS